MKAAWSVQRCCEPCQHIFYSLSQTADTAVAVATLQSLVNPNEDSDMLAGDLSSCCFRKHAHGLTSATEC
jgi:hypothetical protein